MSIRTLRFLTVLAAMSALLVTTAGGAAAAQTNATPATDPESLPHLAFVNVGTCSELAHIVYKLNEIPTADLAATTPDTTAVATPVAISGQGESVTTVNVSLDDLLAEPHAINIHESVEAVDTHIACGDIAGTPSDGQIEIELVELDGSGVSGTATLIDNGDGTTEVKLVVGPATPGATPEASPVS